MSNNDLKNLLHATKPTSSSKNTSIKTISNKTREMMKCFCQINKFFDDNENVISWDYYNIEDLNKLKTDKHGFCILHLTISSLSSQTDDLKLFLSLLTARVDICISESRISQNNLPTTNLDIPGCNIEQTPTESSAGGTIMYISKDICYILRKDLQTYCPKELQSIFIEIIIPNKSSLLSGTIYKHPSTESDKFNNEFLEPLLSKIRAESKTTVLAGDFNLSFIKYNKNKGTAKFLEHLFSNNFILRITLLTRSTSSSQTLIDNIFINNQAFCSVSGNLTTLIPNYLTQQR